MTNILTTTSGGGGGAIREQTTRMRTITAEDLKVRSR